MELVLETLDAAAARLTAFAGRTDLTGPESLHRVAAPSTGCATPSGNVRPPG